MPEYNWFRGGGTRNEGGPKALSLIRKVIFHLLLEFVQKRFELALDAIDQQRLSVKNELYSTSTSASVPGLLDFNVISVDKPTTVQQGGVGLGYVRVQAKGKQDRRRVTGKTDT